MASENQNSINSSHNPIELKQSTIRNKLGRKMTLQMLLIAFTAILGIGFSSVVIEQFLVREALDREAVHFWKHYQANNEFPVPNTDNLKGYLSDIEKVNDGIPSNLKGYSPGYQKMHGQTSHSLLYVSEENGKRLYLLFDGESVLRLSIFFGILPLTIVLVLLYAIGWWVYRESNALLSPIVWLANKFDRFDPAHADASLEDLSQIPGDIDWEVEKLVNSFKSYSRRIQHFVERERAFTRDASHEFRTPLTVIKMASDLLMAGQQLDEKSKSYAARIKGSAKDMEDLIDAFLILARETDKEFENEVLNVRELIEKEIKIAEVYLEDKPIEILIEEEFPLSLETAEKVLSIVLGNIIRNAILYTNEGKVTIRINYNSVEVIDTGIGMSQEQIKKVFQPYYRAEGENKTKRKGYGVGLTIVKRLSNRFDWHVEVQSEVNAGTSFKVIFKH